ncbi:MAG: hypothetical protein L0Z54_06095 [Thermoplasmata archaeon]|nr:hypothetical protein [Thermoplasmata archaeon]
MEAPTAVIAECPTCGEAPHTIVRGRSSSTTALDAVARCNQCGTVHHIALRQPKDIPVRLVVSQGRVSRTTSVDLLPADVVRVGDEFFAGREYVQVRGIETDGKRVLEAPAEDIETIWARSFDKIPVRFSVHRGARSVPRQVMAPPDEEFSVGDVMEVDGLRFAVHKIKCEDGRTPETAQAREIVRVYGNQIR